MDNTSERKSPCSTPAASHSVTITAVKNRQIHSYWTHRCYLRWEGSMKCLSQWCSFYLCCKVSPSSPHQEFVADWYVQHFIFHCSKISLTDSDFFLFIQWDHCPLCQWSVRSDCRLLSVNPLFCLWLLVQDHTYDVRVPADSLFPLFGLLLLQRADVCAADSAHFLGRAHRAHGCQILARKCKKPAFHMYSTI